MCNDTPVFDDRLPDDNSQSFDVLNLAQLLSQLTEDELARLKSLVEWLQEVNRE